MGLSKHRLSAAIRSFSVPRLNNNDKKLIWLNYIIYSVIFWSYNSSFKNASTNSWN